MPPFEVTLGPRVHVDGEGEDRVHVTRYLGKTPDEWKAVAFPPFTGWLEAREDS
eukprot:CAMPEP_0194134728 /NCGR_PEP_ID=MMETSP0152-20130528/4804_1 /TAXON_ID=1049557 /ORGANISM="Thalassiothrix antarctica, Strain L6-D1" /LENGTH=53 /DNA_ID=CAMNT_0038830595 /DNA_START=475 /DNA_END=636 /DNA_ORIENTATION=-